MKTIKFLVVLLLIAAFGICMTRISVARRHQAEAASREYTKRQKVARAAELDRLAAEKQQAPELILATSNSTAPPASQPAAPSTPSDRPPPKQTPAAVSVQPPAPRSRRELKDPLARLALNLVGQDSAAEAYWLDAIFDPSLPDNEREDLMEDLNEEGLANPR